MHTTDVADEGWSRGWQARAKFQSPNLASGRFKTFVHLQNTHSPVNCKNQCHKRIPQSGPEFQAAEAFSLRHLSTDFLQAWDNGPQGQ